MLNMIADLAPYGFMDLLRDKGMIPGEAPRAIVQRTNVDVIAALRNWVAVQGYSFLDLLDDVAAAKAQRGAQVTSFADALAARGRIDTSDLPIAA